MSGKQEVRIPLTKDQAKQVCAFLRHERARPADEVYTVTDYSDNWWKQEPLTINELPTNWAWDKWPAEQAMSFQELNAWFTKGTNQMLPVKGTDEYRVPTEEDVVWKAQIIGTNPDPDVRLALLREAQAGDGDSG